MSELNAVQKTEMPQINAHAAIVVTQSEGKILLEKNARQKMYPAFITKILASIIALEKCTPTDMVTVSQSAVNEIARWKGSAAIGLKAGEQISVLDLVYSMMLVSANDSMFTLAEFISGDKDAFTNLMEEKARSIGASETVLTGANGGFTAEQLSTAYDLAIICRYCMTNSMFRMIAATDKYTIHATNMSEERVIQNTNLLVNSTNKRYRYDTAIGIKSGYTVRSKACLACSALPPGGKYGEELLTIVLGAENTKQMKYVFYDAVTLFDFAFDNFEALSGKKRGEAKPASDSAFITLADVCTALSVKQRSAPDMDISDIACGKQKIKNGCLYFADSVQAAKTAVENGAGVAVCEQPIHGIPHIVVDNVEIAKERLASYLKAKLGIWGIAVLDCPEKVDPMDMAAYVLSEKMGVVKSRPSENSYESMIRSLLSAKKNTGAAIINVSCDIEGNVERMSASASFDVAILSSAISSKNKRELTRQQLIEEKLKICGGMNEAGAVIINIDDKSLAGIFTIPQDIITVGVDNRMADYFADNITIGGNKIKFDIVNSANIYHIELYSDDKHSVYQALETFALGEIMGIPPKKIVTAIESFRKTSGLSKVKNEKGTYVISDFENQSNESVSLALKELCSTEISETARRVAVFSDIAAGDENEQNMFRKVGTLINKSTIDMAVCYGNVAAKIAETINHKTKFAAVFETQAAITEFLRLNIHDGDAVLFKGSSDTGLDEIMTEVT